MPHNDAKHRAKRWNERVKLFATLLNSIAIVTLAAAVINPLASKHFELFADGGGLLIFGGLLSHILAQFVLSFFEAEE